MINHLSKDIDKLQLLSEEVDATQEEDPQLMTSTDNLNHPKSSRCKTNRKAVAATTADREFLNWQLAA